MHICALPLYSSRTTYPRISLTRKQSAAAGDLAWYCVRFALFAFNYEMPESVVAFGHELNSEGVPVSVSGTVFWPGGRILCFDCGFSTVFRQTAEIAGTKGHIRLDDFCIARSHESCEYTMVTDPGLIENHSRVGGKRTDVEIRDCNQEKCMFEHFSGLILAKRMEAFWPHVSLQTQGICDAIMESVAGGSTKVPVRALPTI